MPTSVVAPLGDTATAAPVVGRWVTHVEAKTTARNHYTRITGASWTRPAEKYVFDNLEAVPENYALDALCYFERMRLGQPNLKTAFGIRPGSQVLTWKECESLIPAAKACAPSYLLLGGKHETPTAVGQLNLIDHLHEQGLPKGIQVLPCLDMDEHDFRRELYRLAPMRPEYLVRLGSWAADVPEKLQAIRSVKRRFPNSRIHAINVPVDGPNQVIGSLLFNCFGVDACMTRIAARGGGTNSPLTQADNWPWASLDGMTYRRFEFGAPQFPMVSWLGKRELDLTSVADIEVQTHMLDIRRQHDVAIGSILGHQVHEAAATPYIARHLQRHLPTFWSNLPEDYAKLLAGPIASPLPAAP